MLGNRGEQCEIEEVESHASVLDLTSCTESQLERGGEPERLGPPLQCLFFFCLAWEFKVLFWIWGVPDQSRIIINGTQAVLSMKVTLRYQGLTVKLLVVSVNWLSHLLP